MHKYTLISKKQVGIQIQNILQNKIWDLDYTSRMVFTKQVSFLFNLGNWFC